MKRKIVVSDTMRSQAALASPGEAKAACCASVNIINNLTSKNKLA